MSDWQRWVVDKGENLMTQGSAWSAKRPMKKGSAWEIILNLLFPGIGQIVYGRWNVGIPLIVLNGIFLYILWFIIFPVSLGILLYDRRTSE